MEPFDLVFRPIKFSYSKDVNIYKTIRWRFFYISLFIVLLNVNSRWYPIPITRWFLLHACIVPICFIWNSKSASFDGTIRCSTFDSNQFEFPTKKAEFFLETFIYRNDILYCSRYDNAIIFYFFVFYLSFICAKWNAVESTAFFILSFFVSFLFFIFFFFKSPFKRPRSFSFLSQFRYSPHPAIY